MRTYSDIQNIERWMLCYKVTLVLLLLAHSALNIYLGIEYNPGIPVWNIVLALFFLLSGAHYEKKRRDLVTSTSGYYYHGIDTSSI